MGVSGGTVLVPPTRDGDAISVTAACDTFVTHDKSQPIHVRRAFMLSPMACSPAVHKVENWTTSSSYRSRLALGTVTLDAINAEAQCKAMARTPVQVERCVVRGRG